MLRIIALLFLLSSCSEKTLNEKFQLKYQDDLARIKAIRTPPPHLVNQVRISRAPGREEVMAAIRKTSGDAGKYIGVAQYGENEEFYRMARSDDSLRLPPDIFEVLYDPLQYQSFGSRDSIFDKIRIPDEDSYGFKTKLSEKNYLIIDPRVLQNNIDEISSARSVDSIAHSKILIKENKALRQKGEIEAIFGDLNDDADFDLSSNDS